ncbi:hypothetical protein BS47DRAFT_1362279 [Hydnum rufescens UP504]|uniref:Uncharacterized protein n=1 Tax=Hydnum rufescens UP504 TaxID=1448309 RepID=A0A9P6AZP6_9AGAM|nr:hypothetical protein BS47DRAFT_1362279 [Hydnum rufescens UP504]
MGGEALAAPHFLATPRVLYELHPTATYTVIRKANGHLYGGPVMTSARWLHRLMSPQSVPSVDYLVGLEETPPYPVWSGKLVGGDEGHLWAARHSDEMEKDCRTKNVSKNAKKRHMNFAQTRDTNEGEDWEMEIGRKEDGVTDEESFGSAIPSVASDVGVYTTSKLIHSVLDVGENMRRPFVKFSSNAVGSSGAWRDFEGSEGEINATRRAIACLEISQVDDAKREG